MPTYRLYDALENRLIGHNYSTPYQVAQNFEHSYDEELVEAISDPQVREYLKRVSPPGFEIEDEDDPDIFIYRYWTVTLEGIS